MGLTIYGKFDRLLLEAEVAPTSLAEFQKKYTALAGNSPTPSEYFQIQDNKWGAELRVYFDAEDWVCDSLGVLGHGIEDRAGGGYRSEYQYRINSQDLFWHLVKHGYRLGPNSPIPA